MAFLYSFYFFKGSRQNALAEAKRVEPHDLRKRSGCEECARPGPELRAAG
jgi:hypothetical protein